MKLTSPLFKELPDELVLKILSLLPIFEESEAIKLISKRWEGPWELLLDVKFDDESYKTFVESFMSFLYGSLLSNKAQILERLHLKLSRNYSSSDINFIVGIAVDYRSARELRIDLLGKTLELPSCLSSCTTLKTLILNEVSLKLVPHWFRLASLKTLHLLSVKFSGDETVACLSRICPVLEDLVVSQTQDDNVTIINLNVPTLRSLSIDNSGSKVVIKKKKDNSTSKKKSSAYVEENHGFVIKAPSLTNLNFKDTFSNFLQFESMPEVTKANIEVICEQSDKFIGSLPSTQHLSLCSLTSKTPYPIGTSFSSLEHLELCTCSAGWWDLLACLLNDAPKLRFLKLKSQHSARYNDPMNPFNEPTVVPECLSTHLEILEWRQYEGTEQERLVAAYILANATCLKMATFSTRCRNKHHRMLRKLKSIYIVSKTCQLVFE